MYIVYMYVLLASHTCTIHVNVHVFYVCLYCVAIVADGPMRVRVGTIKDL